MEAIPFSLLTDGTGAATQTQGLGRPMRLYAIRWNGSALTAGADITFTSGGVTIFSLADGETNTTYYPRTAEHSAAGVVSEATVTLPIVPGNLTVTIASGGSAKAATATVYLL